MKIALLGSTGSIGESTLQVIRQSEGRLKLVGMSAHTNKEKLKIQGEEFGVKNLVLTSDIDHAQKLDLMLSEADAIVVAIVGFAALQPTMKAIRLGKRVALANKEALVHLRRNSDQ